ncbi:hypothetical protein OGAPHI_001638 [Ogataea philodendri]|uniref:Uncharacterized protein n=1 Tax=Ogataea philodendri TaxID=1378263 RepID=A0A9P8PCU5_9ASCO|nr:uncharacterized protein OGAPHI_001638 [Ogataea philodendri]KAH3669517.1 hypothetical protein OGAPHI_001638 [Ogataea philodendri]
MVAAFSQLHHNVEQSGFGLSFPVGAIHCIDVSLQQLLVPFLLHFCHSNVHVELFLREQAFFHVRFDSSQKERLKDFMELLNNGVVFIFRVTRRKPLVKGLRVGKNVWKQEIQQRPELVQIVLQRGTCDKHSIFRVERPNDL